MGRFADFKESLNNAVENSFVGRHFRMKERGSNFTTEILAGTTTFLTLAYILPVNAAIIGDTYGPCTPFDNACQSIFKKDLITATAAASGLTCVIMGLWANLPIMLAPGLGINAYFAYTVVGFAGTGPVPYQKALAAVFIEGIIFFLLGVTGWRAFVAGVFPRHLKSAMTVGIGLFLTHIGLQSSNGLGLVTYDPSTLVTHGACEDEYKTSAGQCLRGQLQAGRFWLGAAGVVVIVLCMAKRVRGAMMVGILGVSLISWFRDDHVTYFQHDDAGNARFDDFKKVVQFHAIEKTGLIFDFHLDSSQVWIALVTMFYTDLFDATGTLSACARQAGVCDEDGRFEGERAAFGSDALGIVIGSCMGLSPITAFIESSAGIREGGRTGMTAIVGGCLFFISLAFNPIFANIPPWATGPALCITGSLMMKHVIEVDWEDIKKAIPAFATIIIMPLTYSVAYGVLSGIALHLVIEFFSNLFDVLMGTKKFGQWVSDTIEPFQQHSQKAQQLRKAELNAKLDAVVVDTGATIHMVDSATIHEGEAKVTSSG